MKINEKTKVFVFEGRVCLEYDSTKLFFDEVDSFIEFLQKIFEEDEVIVSSNGDKLWCLNGALHRVNGPAIITASGNKYWYENGNLHRTNGLD